MDDSGIEKQFIGENTGPGTQPLNPEQMLGELYYLWDSVTRYGDAKQFVSNAEPTSKRRYAIVSQHVIIDRRGGMRCRFFIDPFIPSLASDPRTKQLVTVRNRTIGRASSGEPVFSSFPIDAWRFCEEFAPEPTWMSKSEWAAILRELAPIIDRDKTAAAADAEAFAVTREKATQAAAAQDNPSGYLGAAIAMGVASALASLGIEPKQRKAL
jgi:hypothetical protein